MHSRRFGQLNNAYTNLEVLIFGAKICLLEQITVKNRPAGQTALKFRHLLPNVYPTQKL